jgi:predicted RNase H-like HicB family nuclease
MEAKHIRIAAEWDEEAGVFVAQSADLPGLVTEAATAELLVEKLRVMIPELFALNGGAAGPYNFEIAF